MTPPSQFVPLAKEHDRSSFDCGKIVLNDWLINMAMQKQKYNSTRTFVAVSGLAVEGYFSLVFGSVGREMLPSRAGRGVAKEHMIPIILLARLAVSSTAQGKGLGKAMLGDAVRKAALAADIAGLRALLVDAMDQQAKDFYVTQGFSESALSPMKLYLGIDEIREAVGQ